MTNRFIVVFLICVLWVPAGVGQAAPPPASPERPNIVVFLADDLGWNDVGYHGGEIRTPNVDRLAESGVRLEQFYVFPTCTPTRAAFMTGRNPSRFDILAPFGIPKTPAGRHQALPRCVPTLADRLKAVGYKTAIVGKWHLSGELADGPRQYGFDHTYGYLHGQVDPLTHRCKNGDPTWHRNDQFVEEQGHATDLIAREALGVIERYRASPFFLYVAYSVPHYPLSEPEKWMAPYVLRIQNESRRRYAAAVSHMDDSIGRIVAALERQGLRDNTLMVFFSDNGGQRSWSSQTEYEGRYPAHDRLGDNRPLRGWKSGLYEGGIRVPAVVCWPGRLARRSLREVTSVLDLLPTLTTLAGRASRQGAESPTSAPADGSLEGRDLWPALTGTGSVGSRELYWRIRGELAIRSGDWKLIRNEATGQSQLFNLADDPNEKSDLAVKEPECVKQLSGKIIQQRQRDQASTGPSPG